jgi:probable phosphoglycerate mutase
VKQAEALAGYLANIKFTACYSSDLPRAANTARIIAKPHGLPVVELPSIRERCFGPHEGKAAVEIRKLFPTSTLTSLAADGVESDDEVWQRVSVAFREIAARHPGDDILVVCHGGVVSRTIMTTLGLPLGAPRRFGLNNGLLVIIESRPEHFFLLSHVDLPLVLSGSGTPETASRL